MVLRCANHCEGQLPRDFELVMNGKTAKALGVTSPQSVLIRASRVIS
jgi:ABC-type uncharacterized transport system substrate-binding protein